jgi:DNA polymerase I
MMKYAVENMKLRSYSLDSVAKELVGRGKIEIGEYTEIFKAFDHYDKTGDSSLLDEITKYGAEDARLTAEICENELGFDYLIEMSQASGVTCDAYSCLGRMVRSRAMIRKMCNSVLPKVQWGTGRRLRPQLISDGGYVPKPITGLEDHVVTFDFASLYPSIINSFGICYTSLLSSVAANLPFDQLTKLYPSITSKDQLRHIRCDQTDGVYRYVIVKTANSLLP